MAARTVITYVAILGMSFQSYHFQNEMTNHLQKWIQDLSKAASLSESAEKEHLQARESATIAEKDEESSQILHKQSILENDQSEADFALASSDKVKIDELSGAIVEENTQKASDTAKVALDEELFESKTEESVAQASIAAKDEAEAEEDTAITGICEFIPGVDVLCDAVGAVTAIALNSAAAKATLQSGIDAAEAASAKTDEIGELATVDALNVDIEKNNELLIQYKAQEEEEETKGQKEALKSEEYESESQSFKEEGLEEEELSENEETQALLHEEESGDYIAKATEETVLASFHALSATSLSIILSVFSIIRLWHSLGTIITKLPTATTASDTTITTSTITSTVTSISHYFIASRYMTHCILHCCAIVISVITLIKSSTFNSHLQFDFSHLRSRGEFTIFVSIIAAFLQSIFLHTLPEQIIFWVHLQHRMQTTHVCIRLIRFTTDFFMTCLYLTTLNIMQCAFIWIISGSKVVPIQSISDVTTSQRIVCWSIIIIVYLYHVWATKYYFLQTHPNSLAKDIDIQEEESRILLPYSVSSSDSNSRPQLKYDTMDHHDTTESQQNATQDSYEMNKIQSTKNHSTQATNTNTNTWEHYGKIIGIHFEVLTITFIFYILKACIPCAYRFRSVILRMIRASLRMIWDRFSVQCIIFSVFVLLLILIYHVCRKMISQCSLSKFRTLDSSTYTGMNINIHV